MADRAIEAQEQHALRRYSNVAAAFHWTTVLLVLLQLWLGFSMGDEGPPAEPTFTWHKTVGAVIQLLADDHDLPAVECGKRAEFLQDILDFNHAEIALRPDAVREWSLPPA